MTALRYLCGLEVPLESVLGSREPLGGHDLTTGPRYSARARPQTRPDGRQISHEPYVWHYTELSSGEVGCTFALWLARHATFSQRKEGRKV